MVEIERVIYLSRKEKSPQSADFFYAVLFIGFTQIIKEFLHTV